MKLHAACAAGMLCLLAAGTGLAQSAVPTTRPTTTAVGRAASPQSDINTARLESTIRRADRALAIDDRLAGAHQARGEANFRLGRIDQAVRDFDKVVELEPDSLPHNWQRGIALYYAGRFADGAKQFERHREVNPEDVENAAWHYLCVAKAIGPEKGPAEARKTLIPIKADPRVPLMKVQQLFAGEAKPEDVIAAANEGKPVQDELNDRLFYGHLYIGIYYEAQGNSAKAMEHLRLAAGKHAVDGYMGDVARVHVWLAEKPAKP